MSNNQKTRKRSTVEAPRNQMASETKMTLNKRHKLSLICAVCEGEAHGKFSFLSTFDKILT